MCTRKTFTENTSEKALIYIICSNKLSFTTLTSNGRYLKSLSYIGNNILIGSTMSFLKYDN